jgi:hypothetical protein
VCRAALVCGAEGGDAAIVDLGGVDTVLKAMRRHTGDLALQCAAVGVFKAMAAKSGGLPGERK